MAAKIMADYLSATSSPDYSAVALTTPNTKVLSERMFFPSQQRLKTQGVAYSASSPVDDPQFIVTLELNITSQADNGTLHEYWNNTAKAFGIARSFNWDHPTDGETYVAKFFDDGLERAIALVDRYGFGTVRLLILGLPFARTTFTWNPSDKNGNITLSGGDLIATAGETEGHFGVRGTVGRSSGKWFFKVQPTFGAGITNTGHSIGIGDAGWTMSSELGDTGTTYGYHSQNNDGKVYYLGSGLLATEIEDDDFIGVAVNLDTHEVWFSFNDVWQRGGDPEAGTDPVYSGLADTTFYPALSMRNRPSQGIQPIATIVEEIILPVGFQAW